MIILDPDPDPTFQLISDPDPDPRRKKFRILTDPDPQHCSKVFIYPPHTSVKGTVKDILLCITFSRFLRYSGVQGILNFIRDNQLGYKD